MTEDVFDAGELANEYGSIEGYACDALKDIVALWVPSSVRTIGTRAFRNCVNLREVVFEDGDDPLSIGPMAFEGCKSLERVVLPARIKGIGNSCFSGCVNLVDFSIEQGEVQFSMPTHAFDDCTLKEELLAILGNECERRRLAANASQKNGRHKRVIPTDIVGDYILYPAVKSDEMQDLPGGIPNGTLFVCVDRTWGAVKKDDRTNQRIAMDDCARGYWWTAPLGRTRLAECRWLMAISHKKIEGVWKIDTKTGWLPPEDMLKPTWPSDVGPWKVSRRGCAFLPEDDEVRAVKDACLGKDVVMKFTQFQVVRSVFLKQK